MLKFVGDLLQGAPVEWKTLGEIAVFYGGLTGKNRHDFEKGGATYIPYKNIFDNLAVDPERLEKVYISAEEHQNEVRYGDILFTLSSETPDEVGLSSVVTVNFSDPVYLNSFSFGMRFNEGVKVLPEFAKHLFRSSFVRRQIIRTANGVTRFNISKTLFKNISIPIPPLPVQEKIVEILDKFTELEAELEARAKQYEYYRNKLLTFSNEVEWKTLGEVAKLQRGTSVTKKTSMAGKYPVIAGGQHPAYYINQYNRDGETITIAGSGAYAGFVMYWNEPIFVSDAFSIKADETQLLPRYAYYYLQNIQDSIHELKTGGGVPHVYAKDVACFFIPLPPLHVQEKIVSILDKFDTFANSLTEGLPREIALRHKQYEYYRDQLLMFAKAT